MLNDVGLIALGVVWLLVPLWLVGSVYIGWQVLGTLERQAEALEAIADNTTVPARTTQNDWPPSDPV